MAGAASAEDAGRHSEAAAPTAKRPPSPTAGSTSNAAISAFLSALPSTSDGFSRYDASFPPTADTFHHYLPSASDTKEQTPITTEKDRCLIRALKARPAGRKRTAPPPPPPIERKRRRWGALDRERKQACLRVALAAACAGRQPDDGVLGRLRKGWAENPRKKQVVNAEVRQALCATLPRWSLIQLREYLGSAGVEVGGSRSELIAAVNAHLAPE